MLNRLKFFESSHPIHFNNRSSNFNGDMSLLNKYILSKFATALQQIFKGYDQYQLHYVTGNIKQFLEDHVADVYFEFSKPLLYSGEKEPSKVIFYI